MDDPVISKIGNFGKWQVVKNENMEGLVFSFRQKES